MFYPIGAFSLASSSTSSLNVLHQIVGMQMSRSDVQDMATNEGYFAWQGARGRCQARCGSAPTRPSHRTNDRTGTGECSPCEFQNLDFQNQQPTHLIILLGDREQLSQLKMTMAKMSSATRKCSPITGADLVPPLSLSIWLRPFQAPAASEEWFGANATHPGRQKFAVIFSTIFHHWIWSREMVFERIFYLHWLALLGGWWWSWLIAPLMLVTLQNSNVTVAAINNRKYLKS